MMILRFESCRDCNIQAGQARRFRATRSTASADNFAATWQSAAARSGMADFDELRARRSRITFST
jgi:hypothetical protein